MSWFLKYAWIWSIACFAGSEFPRHELEVRNEKRIEHFFQVMDSLGEVDHQLQMRAYRMIDSTEKMADSLQGVAIHLSKQKDKVTPIYRYLPAKKTTLTDSITATGPMRFDSTHSHLIVPIANTNPDIILKSDILLVKHSPAKETIKIK